MAAATMAAEDITAAAAITAAGRTTPPAQAGAIQAILARRSQTRITAQILTETDVRPDADIRGRIIIITNRGILIIAPTGIDNRPPLLRHGTAFSRFFLR